MPKREYKDAKLSPDKPIELADSDKLSFSKLVESVIDLIKLPQPPFTFGLFGKWGTGKSTILGEIEKRLDGKGYYVVTFDAWKYEGDALRRSFLISIAQQLNEKHKDRRLLSDKKVLSDDFIKKLEENIYKDKSEPTLKSNFSWWKIIPLVVLFIVLLIAQIAIVTANPESKLIAGISPLILASIMGFATFIVGVLSPSSIGKLLVKEINIGTDKLSSPEEFHTKFLSILKETKGKTLLVIIDNLDRTQKDVTVKLLGTIKTFLNSDRGKEDVIFLVATDHKAVKRHIKEVYANNLDDAYEAEEFIKKFFNAVIEIPPFVSSEYRDYLADLIDGTKIPTLLDRKDDIISIVSAGYPENPRGAKHFVNSLVVYLLMLSSIGEGAGVEQEFIEKNLSFIAMMLVIRDRFDEVYDFVQEQSLKNEHSWNDIKHEIVSLYNSENSPAAKRRDFSLFYNSVESWIDPTGGSLKWFFNMRRSREEQQLANWDSFVSAVDKKDQEQALKYLGEFYEKPDILNTLLAQHIRSIREETTRWTDFCTTFLAYITKVNPDATRSLQGATKQVFRYFPVANEFYKFANQISFAQLMIVIESNFVEPSERGRVRRTLNEHIRSANISETNLSDVINYELSKDAVNTSMHKSIIEYVDNSEDYARSVHLLHVLTKLDEKREFITSQSSSKVVQSINDQDIDNSEALSAKLAYIRAGRFSNHEIVNKYFDLFNLLQSRGNKENRSIVAEYFAGFLAISRDKKELFGSNIIQNITQYVMNWYRQNQGDHMANKNIVVLLSRLTKHQQNGYAYNAQDLIKQYIESADAENLVFVLSHIEKDDETKLLIFDKLKRRILNDASLYDRVSGEISGWFTSEDISSLALYLVSNAPNLSSEDEFGKVIDLSAVVFREANEEQSKYDAKLYDALNASVSKFPNSVSKYANKKKDNLLGEHHEWLLDLKRKLRELKNTE